MPPWNTRHYHRTNAQIVIGIVRFQIPVDIAVAIRIEVGIDNPTINSGRAFKFAPCHLLPP